MYINAFQHGQHSAQKPDAADCNHSRRTVPLLASACKQSELKEWQNNPPDGCCLESCDELTSWIILMQGPEASQGMPRLYDGQVFRLKVTFPERYPLESPIVVFLDPVPVHPHIYSVGHICLDILYDSRNGAWSPALTINKVCLSLRSMLASNTDYTKPPGDEEYCRRVGQKSPKIGFVDTNQIGAAGQQRFQIECPTDSCHSQMYAGAALRVISRSGSSARIVRLVAPHTIDAPSRRVTTNASTDREEESFKPDPQQGAAAAQAGYGADDARASEADAEQSSPVHQADKDSDNRKESQHDKAVGGADGPAGGSEADPTPAPRMRLPHIFALSVSSIPHHRVDDASHNRRNSVATYCTGPRAGIGPISACGEEGFSAVDSTGDAYVHYDPNLPPQHQNVEGTNAGPVEHVETIDESSGFLTSRTAIPVPPATGGGGPSLHEEHVAVSDQKPTSPDAYSQELETGELSKRSPNKDQSQHQGMQAGDEYQGQPHTHHNAKGSVYSRTEKHWTEPREGSPSRQGPGV